MPRDEGQFLQDVFPVAAVHGGPGRFCFGEEAHLPEDSPLATAENRDRLLRQWGAYLNLSQPVLIEKSPPNLVRSRFLQSMFPDSLFVFIVRHPVAVSLATQEWSGTSLPELVLHSKVAHLRLFDDLERVERALVLRYEDFVLDSDRYLSDICRATGIEFVPGKQRVFDANQCYFDRWMDDCAAESSVVRRLGIDHDLTALGYSLDPPFVTPLPAGSPDEDR